MSLTALNKYEKIGGAILLAAALFNLVPSSWYLMTRSSHEADGAFTERAVALSAIHYYEWKLCDKETGLPNGKTRSLNRQTFLNDAYDKFLELETKDYALRGLKQPGKCRVLKDDEL
jgi:hypothetical protein